MTTRQLDGITGVHPCGPGRLCVHVQQHGHAACAVVTRAQLESAAMRYGSPDARTWTVIGDVWLSQDDVHELLVVGWNPGAVGLP